MLNYQADRRTLVFMFLTTAAFALQWYLGDVHWIIYIAYLYLSVVVSVIAHNHNHVPMWKNDTMNELTDYWITVFYGFPAFAWIPTHNRNHHRYNNKEPDYTKTYRFTEGNNLLTLITYPTISGYFQQGALVTYMKEIRTKNPKKFRQNITQLVVLAAWTIFWLVIDWKKALIFVIIPQQVSLFVVMIFNYVQHIHADEESKYNHSRNMVGSLNFFLLNNGLHTVHHMNAAMHWSLLPEAHAKVEHLIDPSLNEKSFWWFITRSYILGIFIPSCRTKSMRLQRLSRQEADILPVEELQAAS